MKLRSRTQDFIVEEKSALHSEQKGPFGLYRLRKKGLTTPEAVRRVARAADISPGRVRFSGLKDRHAITTQLITIKGKDVKPVKGEGFEIRPIGRSSREAKPKEIIGNTFDIVLRDLSRREADATRNGAEAYARTGIPNYFDEQRFGSARATGEFPGEALARGDSEKALRLIMGTWSREDPPAVKKTRRLVDQHWRDWETLASELGKSTERSIVTYLVHHQNDFRGAFDRLPESLRGIVLAAFQSLLWNETLCEIVRAHVDKTWVHNGRYDDILFFEPIPEAVNSLNGLVVPMAHRSCRSADRIIAEALSGALERHDLTRDSFRLRGFKKTYFWRGERDAIARVEQFASAEPVEDELNPGRHSVKLRFMLPAGAYATMFVKAATGPQDSAPRKRRQGLAQS